MTGRSRQRLEFTWIGKDVRPTLEPRILLEDPTKSYHAKHSVTENDLFDNDIPWTGKSDGATVCTLTKSP